MRTEIQNQQLCSLFESVSSLEFAMKKKLKRDDNGGREQGLSEFVIHALLRWNAAARRWHHRHYLHRRRRHCGHFIPIVTLLGVVAVFSFLSPPVTHSGGIRRRLAMEEGRVAGGGSDLIGEVRDLWSSPSSEFYSGCSNASSRFLSAGFKTHLDRYLLISTSGGLNQQRTGIVDAVVAAYILNATLVVPMLDQNSYWKDSSDFDDIFDLDWFISFLSEDVKIVRQLPSVGGKTIIPVHTRVPRKCTPSCYLSRILPLLKKKHAVQLTKFDYRLSNKLNGDLQKLRCRVNYHALQFTDPILEMGNKLVERMRNKSKHFIALHLRFEPDMLAFSGCDYGGGQRERDELGELRKRWKTLHKSNPDKQRRQGRCPLTPREVGLMLRALGFGGDVHIYVASGEVYRGEETLAPLKALFPNFHSKETIASKEELAPFEAYSARMAALDFVVCDESDVFVTNNNGNMARILAGRRRYFGHKPTIRPNTKKLYPLFQTLGNMTWDSFAAGVRALQVGFMGEPDELGPGPGRGEFHENPVACICRTRPTTPERPDDPACSESGYATDDDERDSSDGEDSESEGERLGRAGSRSGPEHEEPLSDR